MLGIMKPWDRCFHIEIKQRLCVEMEGVGLFTIAKYRECAASAIYIISDVFEDEEWLLGWNGEAISNAVKAVLEVIIESI